MGPSCSTRRVPAVRLDPSERVVAGVRKREWQAAAPSEVEVVHRRTPRQPRLVAPSGWVSAGKWLAVWPWRWATTNDWVDRVTLGRVRYRSAGRHDDRYC